MALSSGYRLAALISSWIERISTSLATFGPDHRLHYSKIAQPRIINGEKCLVVDKSLTDKDPAAFEYILNFVKMNKLRVYEECTVAADII